MEPENAIITSEESGNMGDQVSTVTHPDPDAPGMDVLRSAFGTDGFNSTESGTKAEVTDSEPAGGKPAEAGTGDEEGSKGDPVTPPEGVAQLDDETISKVLSDSRAQGMIRQAFENRLAAERARISAEEEMRRLQEEESTLSDEELGQRQRMQQRVGPVLDNARRQGYEQAQRDFLQHGVGDVWDKVPELKSMSAEERREFDPTSNKFTSYGQYMAAVVEAAVSKRVDARVAAEAKKLADAMVKDRMTDFRNNNPSPDGVSGPSGAPGPIVDVDEMSGRDILSKAFGA